MIRQRDARELPAVESPLRHLDQIAVSKAAKEESRKRQVHLPPISAFRWWARRTESVVGAVIDAYNIDAPGRLTIADPFAGGGTIAFSAASRGHQVFAQEINPWAADGLALAMGLPSRDRLVAARIQLESEMGSVLRDAYSTPNGTLLRTLRVRHGQCPSCSETVKLFPSGLVSLRRRYDVGGRSGWIVCPAGHLGQGEIGARRRCPKCDRLADPSTRPTLGRKVQCWHCDSVCSPTDLRNQGWEVVLVEVINASGRELRPPTEDEIALCDSDRWAPSMQLGPIPHGKETSRLIRAGFRDWHDLYPSRQRYVIESALETARAVAADDQAIRRALELAIVGTVEFAGYSSRWDNRYLKPYETIANHRFEDTTLSVEPHVWGVNGAGRGTVERRLDALERAAIWRDEKMKGRSVSVRRSTRQISLSADTTVVCGSSQNIGAKDSEFDLVLTDPPYHDDVQYGELSSLFRVWAGSSDSLDGDVTVGTRGCSPDHYRELLREIFSDVRRTLRTDGHLILSYANRNPSAWIDLAGALQDAGFHAVGFTFTQSENESDHSKRNRRATTSDLLLDLVPSARLIDRFEPPMIPTTDQDHFLMTVGRWLLGIGSLSDDWELEMRRDLVDTAFLRPAAA